MSLGNSPQGYWFLWVQAEMHEWVESINQNSLLDSELLAASPGASMSAAGEGGPGSPPHEDFKKDTKRRSLFRKKK